MYNTDLVNSCKVVVYCVCAIVIIRVSNNAYARSKAAPSFSQITDGLPPVWLRPLAAQKRITVAPSTTNLSTGRTMNRGETP